MSINWRIHKAIADYVLTEACFRETTHTRVAMTEHDKLARFVSMIFNKMLELFFHDSVIFEEDGTRQVLVNNLSVRESMAERTSQFAIRQVPDETGIVPSPSFLAIHLCLGPGRQAVAAIDADQDLGLEAHVCKRREQWRAADLVALQREYENGPMADVVVCHAWLIMEEQDPP